MLQHQHNTHARSSASQTQFTKIGIFLIPNKELGKKMSAFAEIKNLFLS